jgi:hypothetical protein
MHINSINLSTLHTRQRRCMTIYYCADALNIFWSDRPLIGRCPRNYMLAIKADAGRVEAAPSGMHGLSAGWALLATQCLLPHFFQEAI